MFRATLGIRTRILAIALVPSLTLLVLGVGAAGYLAWQGDTVKTWSSVLEAAAAQAREMIGAVEQERLLSLSQLAGDQPDPVALGRARQRLDHALLGIADLETALTDMSQGGRDAGTGGFDLVKSQLPMIRGRIDARTLPISDAYGIYTEMLRAVVFGIRVVGKAAPDAPIAFEFADTARVLLAAEAMSRAAALTVVALGTPGLPAALVDEYRSMVGYYRAELPQLAADLDGQQNVLARALMESPAWQQLGAMEDYVIAPPSKPGTHQAAPMSIGDWHQAADQVNYHMLELWQRQNEHANGVALDDAATTSRSSLLAGAGVLVLATVAFLASLWLANRLIGRLKRLRTQTLAMAEVELPDVMRRLREGEHIDAEIDSARLDFGYDEIGQVARAFNRAHTAAVAAAVTEARTREDVRAVFLNIAHRSQIVVHRQLELLDEAEARQEDPVLLQTFFRLDHLATRERRNAENLIILGGGKPGRQWRRPVPLIELVRSAVSETLDYTRVRTARLSEVFVNGSVVADLIHLLAELVDNATAFSPPHSRVDVTGNVVGKGVVVEVSDQGMGMPAADLKRANDLLRRAPDFGVAALSADSRLGLFVVARLGARHGISVRLAESDYGGIRAILLIPNTLLTTDAPGGEPLAGWAPKQHPDHPIADALPPTPAKHSAIAAISPTATAVPPQQPDDPGGEPMR
ncbi:nitrate- and nitrite sensing domain-containing protein [Nocardia sp. CA-119907]|uniref:sensor histidine kinase n=1 Tax=Nocardia sp. CA-119907 TaxID=3239973 RepID=UPI003D95B8C6